MVTIGGRGTAAPSSSGRVEQAFFDVGLGDALDRVAQVLGDDLGRVGVERVGQGHHAALTHQDLDDVDGALGHAVGEFLDGDRLGQHDLARDLVLRFLLAVALEALGAAAERRDRTRALLLARGGAGDGETAAVALFGRRGVGRGVGSMILAAGVRTPGRRTTRRASSSSAAGRAARRGGAARRGRARPRRRRPTLRGNVVAGVAAGSPPPRRRRASSSDWRLKAASWARRVSSSRLRASAASRSARSRASRSRALARLALLAAAVFLFARPRVEQRPGARLDLLLGEGAQDDAGLGRRDRRGGGRSARRDDRRAAAAAARRVAARRLGGDRRGLARRRLARSDDAALHLLDHHRLAAAVGKALAHRALLDRPLQVKRRFRRRIGAQGLVAAVVRFTHASSRNPGSSSVWS